MGGSPGAAVAGATAGLVDPRRAALTITLLNLASIVERADEGILPAVYFFIAASLNATLSQLGLMTLCRALVQAMTSPLSGILGDRYDRTLVVASGCLLWGVMTAAIGLSRTLSQAMAACAVNGFGLALVIPCVSSLIADYHPAESRGKAFGFMGLTASLGGMVGGFYATNIGATQPFGVEGWRFAFHLMAGISVATAFAVFKFAVDPRHTSHHQHRRRFRWRQQQQQQQQQHYSTATATAGGGELVGTAAGSAAGGGADLELAGGGGGLAGRQERRPIWRNIKAVLQIRSFQIIIAQGIVGSIPWQAMVWFTVFFQLLGFTDLQAASLMAAFTCGCAVGGLFGGALGDRLARRWPNNGRIFTNQLSVLLGLPLSFVVLKGLARPAVGLYGALLFLFGSCISWAGCNNSALFAELVPEERRSTIYAFDRSFEGAVGALGAPLVGLAAERLFGFSGLLGAAGTEPDAKNVAALSSALLVCMVVPWLLCLLFFTALHWTYRHDRQKPLRDAGEEEVESRPLTDTSVRKRVTADAT